MNSPSQPSSGHTIYHNFFIVSKAEKVFEAISEPRHLINWWPLKCSGKPVMGAEYNFNFTAAYDWYGKVTKCQPNLSFHIKMTKADPDWKPTSFGFELKEEDGKTLVEFSHSGWPYCNEHFKIASYCWAILLKGLKDYIEKGIIIPFEERS